MQDVQPAPGDAAVHGIVTEAEQAELRARDDAVLRPGEPRDPKVDGAFAAHISR
jgi:hypothetical protein